MSRKDLSSYWAGSCHNRYSRKMCSYLICRFAAYGISFSLCQSSALISAIAGMVHVDYTVLGGLQRLSTILPDDAEQLKKTPFAVIQVILSQTARSKMLFCLPIDWVNVTLVMPTSTIEVKALQILS